jgi:hypothetical protein
VGKMIFLRKYPDGDEEDAGPIVNARKNAPSRNFFKKMDF